METGRFRQLARLYVKRKCSAVVHYKVPTGVSGVVTYRGGTGTAMPALRTSGNHTTTYFRVVASRKFDDTLQSTCRNPRRYVPSGGMASHDTDDFENVEWN